MSIKESHSPKSYSQEARSGGALPAPMIEPSQVRPSLHGKPAAAQNGAMEPEAVVEIVNRWPSDTEIDFILHALDSAAIVAITDVKGTITFVNRKFVEISGYSEAELIGQNHRMLRSGVHPAEFFRQMYSVIAHGHVWSGEICNRRKDGSLYWVQTTIVPRHSAEGKLDHYVAIRFDITDRKLAENRLIESQAHLKHSLNTDFLTRLANRQCFTTTCRQMLERAARAGEEVYLGILDVDHFKDINDSYGHFTGDKVLCALVDRLRTLESQQVFLARLGGDEFAILVRGLPVEEAVSIFEKVLEQMRAPVPIDGVPHRVSGTIGYAYAPNDGESQEELFKAADIALYAAKSLGRDRYQQFHSSMREEFERKVKLIETIHAGLDRKQFELHYQPLFYAGSGRPPSLEALLRWRHPWHGMMTPTAFFDVFKDPGTAQAVGNFVLDRALADARQFIDRGVKFNKVAVNITAADLANNRFPARLFGALERYGLPPSRVAIEVTEGIFLDADSGSILRDLNELHERGIEIALDDFGTGFASLTHLLSMPFDRIKIDKSFISELEDQPANLAIVQGIIEIVHRLGRLVVAEGVERQSQKEILERLGCDAMQGWLIARALSPQEVETILQRVRY